jgi:hypothetical protein
VGIGTTSPTSALDVSGIIKTSSTIYIPVTNSSSTGIIYNNAGIALLHAYSHPTGSTVKPVGRNVFIGGAGNFYMGSTATNENHGSDNLGIGNLALLSLTLGNQNMAMGYSALRLTTTGYGNTAIGAYALYPNTVGYSNVAIGTNAGRATSAGDNTNTITNNSIYIGTNTKALATNQINQIVIGYGLTGIGSNSLNLANTIYATGINGINGGNVGIGIKNPDAKLSVSGGMTLKNSVAPTLTSTSGAIFVSGGELWYLGSAGTSTRLAVA